MQNYLELLKDVLDNGVFRDDRTGIGTYSLFGKSLRYDLKKGFPAITTKMLYYKGVLHEMLWFIKGDDKIDYLKENGITIWDAWVKPNGSLGPVYGVQWRNWTGRDNIKIDQLENVINQIKTNPNSRRLLVTAWNPTDLPDMALPPCHLVYQFYVVNGELSCLMYMRSVDLFLGLPFDIASYATLTHCIAQVCGLNVGELIINLGDTHIYSNHIEQVKLQLEREPYELPTLVIDKSITNINDFKYEHFKLENYKSHPKIKADIAV